MSKEQVLVFPAAMLKTYLGHFGVGVVTDPFVIEDMVEDVLWPGVAHYMYREAAEKDTKYKQVIPYCVLTQQGRAKTPFYFAYQRTKKGGESRLHERWSLGVGGHINPCDGDAARPSYDGNGFPPFYEAALRRELLEEVSLTLESDAVRQAPVAGLIYDDSDEVGKVHFGVVHLVNVPMEVTLAFRDPSLDHGVWMGPDMLRGMLDKFENWSKLVIERILPR